MEDLKKSRNNLLFLSIILTIFLIGGIPAIVFGATKGIVLLLVVGIICTVLGFYVMPICWVVYGERGKYIAVLSCIVKDNILKVDNIKQNLGITDIEVKKIINYLINKRYLTGYLFIDEKELKKIEQKKDILITKKCPYCGANIELTEKVVTCKYCNAKFKINDN